MKKSTGETRKLEDVKSRPSSCKLVPASDNSEGMCLRDETAAGALVPEPHV